jgi:hypothetical protein
MMSERFEQMVGEGKGGFQRVSVKRHITPVEGLE